MSRKSLFFLSVGILLAFSSCTNSVSDSIAEGGETESSHATKLVTLNLNEEQITETSSQSEMTRAGSEGQKYYGINVYKKNGKNYEKYAYGLFNTTDNISVLMEEGEKYKFECVEIRNDKDTVGHDGNRFYYPFIVNRNPGELTNDFVKSKSQNLEQLTSGCLTTGKEINDTTWYPKAYTLYGALTDFDPATSANASIQLNRAVFGINFKITPPKDGTVVIRYLNDWYITLNAGDENYEDESIYSFHQIKPASEEGYNTKLTPAVTWTYSDGTEKKSNFKIPVSRNNITTVELSFSGPAPGGIAFTEDDSDFTRDTVNIVVGK